MADKKITQLNNITGADLAEADEFVVVDITADETKAITFSELKTAFDTGTGFVRITGDTMTGDLSFGDNDKAIFGAGSDLQIYHDGSNSYITDVDTGNLYLEASAILMRKAGTSENIAKFIQDNRVELYYDNASKLTTTATGIDVTGTVTSDGLTVDGTSGYVRIQDLNASVVSGTDMGGIEWRTADSTVVGANRITATINVEGDETFNASDKAPSRMVFSTHGISGASPVERMRISYGGDISFYEDTGTTAKFFWDASAERLGIGTSSPSGKLTIANDDTGSLSTNLSDYSIVLEGAVGTGSYNHGIVFNEGAAALAGIGVYDGGTGGRQALWFATKNSSSTYEERMRIDSSGNLLVGVTSTTLTGGSLTLPNSGIIAFHDAGGDARNTLQFVSGELKHGAAGGGLTSQTFFTSATERMRIDSSGNVGIGTSSPNILGVSKALTIDSSESGLELSSSGTVHALIASNTQGANIQGIGTSGIRMFTSASGSTTERMRIDSSGNLLVGKTASNYGTSGMELSSVRATFTRDGGNPLLLNRLSSDGDIAVFAKNGTTVGSIGVDQYDNYTVSSNRELIISTDRTVSRSYVLGDGGSSNGIFYPTTDNDADFGSSSKRWKDLYLSGGVYLGGTGSANKLEDYEEGTWTPILGGSTGTSGQSYSTQHGSYTKIGRVVHLQAYVVMASIGTSTGAYGQVQNLPFTAAPVQGYGGGIFQYFNLIGGTSVSQLIAYPEGNSTFAYVLYTAGAGTTTSYLGGGGWGSAPRVMLSMTYLTNA